MRFLSAKVFFGHAVTRQRPAVHTICFMGGSECLKKLNAAERRWQRVAIAACEVRKEISPPGDGFRAVYACRINHVFPLIPSRPDSQAFRRDHFKLITAAGSPVLPDSRLPRFLTYTVTFRSWRVSGMAKHCISSPWPW